jgi:hypothetical protein
MNNIKAGDRVTWHEGGRTWTGVAVRVGVLHTLVAPDGGATDWIRTDRLTRVSPIALVTTDYEAQREYGDMGGREG